MTKSLLGFYYTSFEINSESVIIYGRIMDQNDASESSIRQDEPTQYELNYSSPSLSPQRAPKNNKKKVVFICIGIAILIGAAFFIAYSMRTQEKTPVPASSLNIAAVPSASIPAPTPSITITLQKTSNGPRLTVQWEYLPDGTVKIEIFRAASPTSPGVLIGTVAVASSSLAGGSASFNIPGKDQDGYYYGIAAGDDGLPLFNSTPAPLVNTSSTSPPLAPSSNSGNGAQTTSPTLSSPSSSQSQTQNQNNQTPATTTNENTPQENNSSGIENTSTVTYYTPQGSISGTASETATENFWVQHVDQKIQIGWQNLPLDTNRIVISRSASDDGPWVAVLTQNNPVVDMPYSIQIVDDTLGSAYYYKMDGHETNGTTNTYGPVLLGPLSQ